MQIILAHALMAYINYHKFVIIVTPYVLLVLTVLHIVQAAPFQELYSITHVYVL
jgi:hypothetical protein